VSVYLVVFLIVLTVGLLSKNVVIRGSSGYWNQDKSFLIFVWIVLSLLEGLRAYSVGTDTYDYINSFATLDWKYETYEPLSKLMVLIVRTISHNPTVYLIICALVINGLILNAIYKMSNDRRYSVFIFISLLFYFTSFNAIRQAFAYACMINAFYYIRERKWIKFAIFLILAIEFHSSAIIGLLYLLIPILDRRKENSSPMGTGNQFFSNIKYILITIVLSAVFRMYFDKLIVFFVQFFPMYEGYLFNEYRDMVGGIQEPIVYSAIFVCFMFLVPNDAKYKKCYALPLSVAVIFAFASLKMAYIARFMYYFNIVTVITIPYMLKNNIFDKKSKTIIKVAITTVCIAFLFYGLLNNYMRVLDYMFVWQ